MKVLKKKFYYILSLLLILGIPSIARSQIIVKNNFDGFSEEWVTSTPGLGHQVTGTHGDNLPGPGAPEGWTGYIKYGNNDLRITTEGGRNNSPCLRIGPEYGSVTNQVGLTMYLPNLAGDYDGSGYDELYIRFYVKYSQNWKWKNSFVYQKWLRLWQNVPLNRIKGNAAVGDEPDQNMANEENTGYIIIGVGEDQYAEYSPYVYSGFCMGFPSHSSSGKLLMRYSYSYTENSGFIENAYGNIKSDGSWEEDQDWHCWEFHVKLSSSWDADDGVIQMWFDGVEQTGAFSQLKVPINTGDPNGVADPEWKNYVPTPKLGTGINYITLHDNADSYGWDEQGYVYIDDFVVSTSYIGPAASAPSPKLNKD